MVAPGGTQTASIVNVTIGEKDVTVDVALNTVLVVVLVTGGVKMLEMMLEKSEEMAVNLTPKNGSATRTLTGKLTGTGLLKEDWIAYGEAYGEP